MQPPVFRVIVNGEDIEFVGVKDPPIRIIHSGAYEEFQARSIAGLSQSEYDQLPGDPDWITVDGPQVSKAHVVAYARLKNRIDAVYAEAAERKSRRGQ